MPALGGHLGGCRALTRRTEVLSGKEVLSQRALWGSPGGGGGCLPRTDITVLPPSLGVPGWHPRQLSGARRAGLAQHLWISKTSSSPLSTASPQVSRRKWPWGPVSSGALGKKVDALPRGPAEKGLGWAVSRAVSRHKGDIVQRFPSPQVAPPAPGVPWAGLWGRLASACVSAGAMAGGSPPSSYTAPPSSLHSPPAPWQLGVQVIGR